MQTEPKLHTNIPAAAQRSIGKAHVESEESSSSVREFPKVNFIVDNFSNGKTAKIQILSADIDTGESTQRVHISKGWSAPIGNFTENVELFVLKGKVKQGGFPLRYLSYSYIPAGVLTGLWIAQEDSLLFWMPEAKSIYVTEPYAQLPQIPENSVYHKLAQNAVAVRDYIPSLLKKSSRCPGKQRNIDIYLLVLCCEVFLQ